MKIYKNRRGHDLHQFELTKPILQVRKIIVFFFIVLYSCSIAKAQSKSSINFSHLTIDDGLSSNRVYGVVQDLDGFMWIGTNNGLNRYNGYEFKHYLFEPNNKYSIPGNEVQTLYVDKSGILWVGTNGRGFCYYNKVYDRFVRFSYFENCSISTFIEDIEGNLWVFGKSCIGKFHKKSKKFENISSSISNMPLIRKAIQSNESHILWVGTETGLYTFNTQNNEIKPIKNVTRRAIYSLYLDKDKTLWIGCENNTIKCLNTHNLSLKHYTFTPQNSNSLINYPITSFLEDGQAIWVGSLNGGLGIFDKNTQQFKYYTYQKNNKDGLNDNAIGPEMGLFKDWQGRVWIPTNFGGLNIVDKYAAKFYTITDLPNPTVNVVLKDSQKRLWIGTEKGLVKIYPDGKKKEYLDFPILSIEEDYLGKIWIGSWQQGVLLYNETEDKFIQFIQKNGYNRNSMFKVIPEKSFIWLSTIDGLSKMEYDKLGTFLNYNSDCQVSNATIQHSFKIKDKIWICSDKGLKIFDINTKKTICFTNSVDNPQSLSANFITNVLYDSKQRYWIGTKEGLNLKTGEQTFKRITKADGLPSDAVNSLLEDNKGYLWIATNKGLSKYNPEKNTFRNYDVSDGLQSNEFRWSSCFKDKDGFLYFGGVKGLNIFHPDSIRDNTHIPQVYISGLKIFNQPILIGDTSKVLTQNISLTKSLTFDYTQSVFTLEFVALNYTHPEKNQYAYKLEGFDKDWVYVGNKREAIYTNLDASTYTFRVKASNNDGIWNEEGTSITIIILPPWWETWWFRIIVITLFLSSGIAFYLIRINAIKKQNKRLELIVKKRTFEIHQQNEEILAQNEEIQTQNEELSQQQEEIVTLNNNLELLVEERTKKLLRSNQKLSEYAFFNAHKLRAPIATILGLYELLKYDMSLIEREVILEKIKESIVLLDEMVRKNQSLLDEVEG